MELSGGFKVLQICFGNFFNEFFQLLSQFFLCRKLFIVVFSYFVKLKYLLREVNLSKFIMKFIVVEVYLHGIRKICVLINLR